MHLTVASDDSLTLNNWQFREATHKETLLVFEFKDN